MKIDPTEDARRALVAVINCQAADRATLEERYGQVWNTSESSSACPAPANRLPRRQPPLYSVLHEAGLKAAQPTSRTEGVAGNGSGSAIRTAFAPGDDDKPITVIGNSILPEFGAMSPAGAQYLSPARGGRSRR